MTTPTARMGNSRSERRRLGWVVGLLLSATVLSRVSSEASAAPPSTDASTQSTVVLIVSSDEAKRFASVVEAARTNLAAQGVTLSVLERGGDEHPARLAPPRLAAEAVGVFWFDDTRSGTLRVVLQTRGQGRFSRSVPGDPLDSATRDEAVWLILQTNSLALAMGARPSMDVEPEEPPADDALAPPSGVTGEVALDGTVEVVPLPRVLELGAHYASQGVGQRLPWQHGVELEATFHMDESWLVGLGYAAAIPDSRALPIGWQHAVELRGGARRTLGRRVELRALASVGVGALQWIDRDAARSGWRAVATAAIDAGVQIRIAGPISLWIAPGGVARLNPFALTECSLDAPTCSGEARRVVFEFWPVQPRLRAGLRVALPSARGRR